MDVEVFTWVETGGSVDAQGVEPTSLSGSEEYAAGGVEGVADGLGRAADGGVPVVGAECELPEFRDSRLHADSGGVVQRVGQDVGHRPEELGFGAVPGALPGVEDGEAAPGCPEWEMFLTLSRL
jgi:hypothetical protein